MSDSEDKEFVDPPEDAPEFVTDAPKGAIIEDRQRGSRGRSYNGPRTANPPKDEIEQNRLLYNQDPHVGHAVEIVLDWLLADGYNLSPRNVPGIDVSMDRSEVAKLRKLIVNSNFNREFHDWIEKAATEGHAFMELVVENDQFKPRLLPFERMHKFTDEFGNVEKYILEPPEGGGPEAEEAEEYDPSGVAEFYFRKEILEEFGHALIERVGEQADMLRDMEIDYARFVASKAYPPVLWKLGSEENQWSEDQIDSWLDDVEEIQPDSMLAGPHDVDTEVVGTTSTSSSAGAMRLEETFKHHQRRIITGIGVPAVIANMDDKGASAESVMPAFKRRIRRYQSLIKEAVEQQILKPLFVEVVKGSELDNYTGLIPEFEFGEYSSAEKRLNIDTAIKLFNNGFLTRKAFAKRVEIDPETEMPDVDQLDEDIIPLIEALAGTGDRVQNPDGGRPSDTGGGAQSAGGEVSSRERSTSAEGEADDRAEKSPTEDTNA